MHAIVAKLSGPLVGRFAAVLAVLGLSAVAAHGQTGLNLKPLPRDAVVKKADSKAAGASGALNPKLHKPQLVISSFVVRRDEKVPVNPPIVMDVAISCVSTAAGGPAVHGTYRAYYWNKHKDRWEPDKLYEPRPWGASVAWSSGSGLPQPISLRPGETRKLQLHSPHVANGYLVVVETTATKTTHSLAKPKPRGL